MGALEELQDFVKTKVETIKKKFDNNANNAANPGQGDTTHGVLGGFPFVNYAMDQRITPRPLIIPRQKYTYLVEFHVNEKALLDGVNVTNLKRFLTDGKFYQQLKRIDHPKPTFAVETLRSYNKYIKLPTKMEFPPASMTFDDDATSMTAALIKEYINFYSHSGDVGTLLVSGTSNTSDAGPVRPTASPPNFNSPFGNDAFSFDQPNVGYNHLISNAETDTPRSHMESRHSMGLKLKPNYKRHFFDSIVIYDLGTEPNSINIYYFYKPVFTSIDHAGLDTEDRTSKVEVNVSFEYENYYFVVGRNAQEVSDSIKLLTGVAPPESIVRTLFTDYHGAMADKVNDGSTPVSEASPNPLTPMPDVDVPATVTPVPPPGEPGRPPGEISSEIEEVRQKIGGIASATSSAGATEEELNELTRLNRKLDELNSELSTSTEEVAEIQKREQAAPATQSAVENTKKQMAAATEPVDSTIENPSSKILDGRNRDQWQKVLETNISSVDFYQNRINAGLRLIEKSDTGVEGAQLLPEVIDGLNEQIAEDAEARSKAANTITIANEAIEQIDGS